MTQSSTSLLEILERSRAALATGALDEDVAQSAGVGAARYVAQERWAGIIVAAQGANEQGWSRREELSSELYEKLAASHGPPISEALAASFRELDTSQPVQPTTCTNCRIRPGFGPCPRCSGVGVLLVQSPTGNTSSVDDCPECEDGFATCTVCGGSTRTISATVRYVNRTPLAAQHLVLPNAVADLAGTLRGAFSAPGEIPAELAIELEADESATAYRGAQPGAMTDFRGYSLGDAARRALGFARRVRVAPNFLLRDLRTFAMPFITAAFSTSGSPVRIVMFVDTTLTPRFVRQ